MNKVTFAVGCIIAASTPAFAADLPYKGDYLRPALPADDVVAINWTGAYFGLYAGAAAGGQFRAGSAIPKTSIEAETSLGGFSAGGTIGYNYQFGARDGVVIGVEVDGGYASFAAQSGVSVPGLGFNVNGGLNSEPFMTTVRGRLGYAFGPALVYATGGYGVSMIGFNGSVTVPGISLPKGMNWLPDAVTRHFPLPGYSGSVSNSAPIDGYVIGGGIEYAISPNWSIKSEYLYADFKQSGAVKVGGAKLKVDVGYDVHQMRIGINHRLNFL